MQPYLNVGQVFEFTAPNDIRLNAVVVAEFYTGKQRGITTIVYLCYSQNRLFTYNLYDYDIDFDDEGLAIPNFDYSFGYIICEYCIIPEYDELLK